MSLRLVFQYKVLAGILARFLNIMKDLFWNYDGVSGAKWITSEKIHVFLGKPLLGLLNDPSEQARKDHVTID